MEETVTKIQTVELISPEDQELWRWFVAKKDLWREIKKIDDKDKSGKAILNWGKNYTLGVCEVARFY